MQFLLNLGSEIGIIRSNRIAFGFRASFGLSCLPPSCYYLRGSQMTQMSGVVQQLKKEREHAQRQVQRIDEALAALGSSSNGASRTMSAAGRRKISLAQKARWAKAKGHAPKPKRTMSVTARRKIATAQRARWAKLKRAT
jgi:hypothetical protein